MKRIYRRSCTAWKAPVRLAALTGLAWVGGHAEEAPRDDGASPLIARPLAMEPAEVLTGARPKTAVAAVPLPDPVSAEDAGETAAPDPPKAPANFRSEKSLAEFLGDNEAMALKNVTDSRSVRIPVPWRAKWPEMRVDLGFQNSGALDSRRSQMELWWANGMVAQRVLDGGAPDGRLLAEIPNRHLRPGAHSLELRLLHQTGEAQGDPFSEELWTQVDSSASSLTLSHQLRSLNPVLSDFPRLMDRHGWEPFRLRVVTAEPWALTEIHLEWISRVVERSALMLESVPLEVTHGSVLSTTGDHIVIGLRDEIVPALPEEMASEITDSFAGIFPHPLDDRFFVAVIAGSTREGIEKAVRVFSATEFILPPAPVVDLTNFFLPDLPPGPPVPVLQPGEERSFAKLGVRTRELQGLTTEGITIPVHLPPGVTGKKSAKLMLELQMAWSPVRKDATVAISVNGRPEATIPIGKSGELRFDDYEVAIPLSAFRPGENRITFQPQLIPPHLGDRKSVNWDSLRFVLDDHSRVILPAVDREIRLPDLQLTARSAVPAIHVGSLASPQSFTIMLSARESPEISAGCTLLGKFIQTGGRRVPLSRMSFEKPPADSNYLVVGSEEALPSALIPAGANLEIGGGDRALVAQFESPLKDGRIGMVVAAALDADVSECARELISPDRWDRLSGDTFTWGRENGEGIAGPGQFRSVAVYHDADVERRSGAGFSAHWILYPLGLLLLVGGGVTFYLRRERRRNRLPGRVSIDGTMWSLRGEDRI